LVVFVVAAVEVFVVEEVLVLVLTVLAEEEHAPASTASATTHAASPARRREVCRSREWDGFTLVGVRFVMVLTTGGSPVRFTEVARVRWAGSR
jgi:hypothetical protein